MISIGSDRIRQMETGLQLPFDKMQLLKVEGHRRLVETDELGSVWRQPAQEQNPLLPARGLRSVLSRNEQCARAMKTAAGGHESTLGRAAAQRAAGLTVQSELDQLRREHRQ